MTTIDRQKVRFEGLLIFVFLVLAVSLLGAQGVYADEVAPAAPATPTPAAPAALPQPVELPNPLGTSSPQVIIGRAALALTGISGSIALVMFIYGGFTWLTAGGNPERIKKGKEILVWAVIGLAIMFSAYIVVRYVLTALTRGVVTPR